MKKSIILLFVSLLVLSSCSVTKSSPVSFRDYPSELEVVEASLSSSGALISGETYHKRNIQTVTEMFSNTKVILPVLPTEELNSSLRNVIDKFLTELDYPFEPECVDFFIEDLFFTRTFVFYISDTSELFNSTKLKFSYNTSTDNFIKLNDFLDKKTVIDLFGKNHTAEFLRVVKDGIYVFDGTEERFVSSDLFSKEKFITVFHPEVYEPVSESDKKFVALTFDDGPNPYTTNSLLDYLDEKDVKATFFMLGVNISEYRSTVKKAFEQGHDIGIHSYKHTNFDTMDGESIIEDLDRCSELLYSIIGKYPYLVRPPFGNLDVNKIDNDGYFFVNWNVDPVDWDTDSADAIAEHVISKVSPGSIILLHDIYKSTCDAVEIIVDKLLEDGYRFVTISEFYDLNGKKTDNKLHFIYGDYNG